MTTKTFFILGVINSVFVLTVGADPPLGRKSVTNAPDIVIGVQSVTNAYGKITKQIMTLHRSSALQKIQIARNQEETKPEVLSALARWCIQNLNSYAPDRLDRK